MSQLTFIDFFAGIGGFRSGLDLAGMTCIGYCEKDKFAVRSYQAMYDTEGEWYSDDITKLKPDDIPKADLWCAGSPCQNVSIAGKRAGLYGERSGLFFTFVDLIQSQKEEDKPEWVLLENVKGLLSSGGGRDYLDYLSILDQAGYDLEWQVFNSKDYGVPQNRERVYTIGHLRSRGRRQVLPIQPESCGNLKQLVGGVQGERIYDVSGVSTSLLANSGGSGAKTGLYLIDQSTTKPILTVQARCLTARYTAGSTKRTAMNSGVMEVQPILTPDRVQKRQNGRRVKDEGEPMFTLTSQDRHGVLEGIKVRNGTKQGYQVAELGDSVDLSYPASPTRRARVGKGIAHNLSCSGQMGAVVWNGRMVKIRRLTPRECFRLQGFTDDLFEKAQAVNSDAQLYKQAGNGVTVTVVYAIGKAILSSENDG
ncbi:DNA (cytosine-5-)-methyltransferase [Streptococcus suis]|uniref:DNA (cytosine-5-)-methyltransferase n=1 Tax=Streptococcus suis TaxID=1307 RepID=A0A0Z8KNG3_STRSU|nr:DNA (cytosine-5-)-methyltransferase [Streptococcus suis]NQG75372.1 DNA (cytosine-5-)-methyltransferase [Streptococcus suis]NQG79240.1 DNA (cytosine-5-)-methyltransferase [Streptococcus suis]CYV75313.1 DNA-cytosine methyltransferase [Streptococcus suis]CYV79779.1 DNA-cytosine methyltransferase [Streptococcus suis]HEM5250479.1 DNA (cytosine-5-)-methyltransferase [Streptococcus suis]